MSGPQASAPTMATINASVSMTGSLPATRIRIPPPAAVVAAMAMVLRRPSQPSAMAPQAG